MMAEDLQHIINNKELETMPLLKALFDKYSYKILLTIVDESKTAIQICNENENAIPISSTYKKIKKLKEAGLIFIEKIVIKKDGKKIVFYKSKIQSIEMTLNKKQFILQLKKNENNFSKI